MPEELWQDFAKIGLLGCLIPEAYGGSGMGLVAQALGFESITALGTAAPFDKHGNRNAASAKVLAGTKIDMTCVVAGMGKVVTTQAR